MVMNSPRYCFPVMIVLALATPRPDLAQGQGAAPELKFWTVGGSDGFIERFGTGFSDMYSRSGDDLDRVLLAIAERPLTQHGICEITGLPAFTARDLIASLAALRLIRKDDVDRWATTVPVITDRRMKSIKSDLLPIARAAAGKIEAQLAGLRALYDESKSPLDPSWDDVAHLVVDKFIIDGTFHTAINDLERETGALRHYSQEQRSITAFFIELGDNFSTFGSNWYPFKQGAAQREVYVLHGALFQRYDIRMNAYRGDPDFSSALFAMAPDGGIGALANRDRALLDTLDWIAGDRLLVPVVQANTIKSIWPTLQAIGRSAAEVVLDNQSVIIDSFDRSPYSEFLDAGGDYIQVCYHTLFGAILERLAEAGDLPPIPQPVPEYFGVYIIMGKLF